MGNIRPVFLVVDDALFMRKVLEENIRALGYTEIYQAEDGNCAVDKAAMLKPDIITLDISMPELDGISAIKKLREVSPKSKIIMVSALTSQITVIEAIKNGAVDFIAKPVDREVFQKVMNKHVKEIAV